MTRTSRNVRPTGFTLIELMVALGIFLVISGVAFSLLGLSQQRYQSESQVSNAFQDARLALDEIVRDVNGSGFPPPNQFSFPPTVLNPPNASLYASTPFAWSPGYPATPCLIGTAGGGTCSTATAGDSAPGDFDLIVETNITPQVANSPVQWIRYQLQGTTLYRGTAPKVAGDDPDADTFASGVMLPYVQNVMNNASAGQIAQFQAAYPGMFPGGTAVPIFSYICDSTPVPQPCPLAAGSNSPMNIRDVAITLIVMAPSTDAQASGRPLLVQLNGRARRINPNF
jgi:prepilin-type N-terminal cleavage/methylation domain-containing protein